MSRSDWLPSRREDQLLMADSWGEKVSEQYEAWKVPQATITKLSAAATEARSSIKTPPGQRDPVANARIRMAFKELTAQMRDMRKRHFFMPPLTEMDLAALGLRPRDSTPTNVPPPAIPVEGRLTFPAIGLVEMREMRATGEKRDVRSKHGVRIYYGIMGTPSETDRFRISARPSTGDDLPHSVFTRRNRYRFDFTGESGREIFFCMRFENSKGESGPWGEVISAFIP